MFFFATAPETKSSRWPNLRDQSDDRLAVGFDFVAVAVRRPAIQLKRLLSGVMLSPIEAKMMIGDVIDLRSKNVRARVASPAASLLPDEQMVDDPSDLFVFHQVIPPHQRRNRGIALVGCRCFPPVVVLYPKRVAGFSFRSFAPGARRRTCPRRDRSRARMPCPAMRPRIAHRILASLPDQRHGRAVDTIAPTSRSCWRREASLPSRLGISRPVPPGALRVALSDQRRTSAWASTTSARRWLLRFGKEMTKYTAWPQAARRRPRVRLEDADSGPMPGADRR